MSGWNTVAIFGVGLIGGSIGMALRQRGLAQQVMGLGRDAARLSRAQTLGAITASTTQVEEAARAADLVVICTPVKFLFEHLRLVAQHCGPKTLITDAGSTKLNLVQQVEAELPTANFVGSHPLAGSDRSGVEHASGDLFEGRTVVVTPTGYEGMQRQRPALPPQCSACARVPEAGRRNGQSPQLRM